MKIKKVKKTTKVFDCIFKAIKYALEVRSYHFEVFNHEGYLIGYGVPK